MNAFWKRVARPVAALAVPAVWWWIGRLSEQLTSGAAPWSLENLAVFAGTLVLGLLCSVWSLCSGKSQGHTPVRQSDSAGSAEPILHALDVLFQHFPGDAAARGAVRKVAHAVTDQRYADSPTSDNPAETEVRHG